MDRSILLDNFSSMQNQVKTFKHRSYAALRQQKQENDKISSNKKNKKGINKSRTFRTFEMCGIEAVTSRFGVSRSRNFATVHLNSRNTRHEKKTATDTDKLQTLCGKKQPNINETNAKCASNLVLLE